VTPPACEARRAVGCADYLGTLQRYRAENPRDPHFPQIALFLLDFTRPSSASGRQS
jgi:hypothetical protein